MKDGRISANDLATNNDINDALGRGQLLDAGEKGAGRFSAKSLVMTGGANLSLGQRKLLCLARAILKKTPKIIILDEATSAVDGETDSVMQKAIREVYQGTLIVMAHRLEMVVSLDRVLVMRDGMVAENGSPAQLLLAGGLFDDLVEQSQDGTSLNKMILGKNDKTVC